MLGATYNTKCFKMKKWRKTRAQPLSHVLNGTNFGHFSWSISKCTKMCSREMESESTQGKWLPASSPGSGVVVR